MPDSLVAGKTPGRANHLLPGIALLGTGNHIRTCLSRRPTLSSVSFPWRLMEELHPEHRWVHRQLQSTGVIEPECVRPYQVEKRASTPPPKLTTAWSTRRMATTEEHPAAKQPLQELAQAMACSTETLCAASRNTSVSRKKYNCTTRWEYGLRPAAQESTHEYRHRRAHGYGTVHGLLLRLPPPRARSPTGWKRGADD